MSQHEQDREDLLREATALVERVELQLPGYAEPIVIGFRRNGAASVYLGGDPVFQFNAAGELRRAFLDGQLIKAERGHLVWLERKRSADEVTLLRRQVSIAEQARFLELISQHLNTLQSCLAGGSYTVLREVPADANVSARGVHWLRSLPSPLRIAAAPSANR